VNAPSFTPDAEAMASQLFDVIACADTTLRVAVYEADWDCIAGAIDAQLARDPDLQVEIVVDDDICAVGSCFADTLTPADRVTVVRDNRGGLMHHKFVIADDARLWVSSANFTYNSFCGDHNNAIVLEQPEIVTRYGAIFTRMFVDNQFGPVSPEAPTTGGDYTAYFLPESRAGGLPPQSFDEIIAAIEAATSSIDIMINAWTRTEVSDAVIAALGRSVRVRALVSHLYADDAPAQALLAAGIDIRRDNIHDKVMIVDADTVLTGSANWSENSWTNNENSLWIANASVAAAYQAEFDTVYGAARPVTAP
jgi:phosphatidylserine/phosphatidylglycerophosphate/cardiolipin synthase-like enzyme